MAGKAAIDAAVAAGLYEERVIIGGKDKDGKPVRISQIRFKDQKSKASHKVPLSDSQVVAAHVELWRPECCSSARPRKRVSRRDTLQVETHCRSSWKGSGHAPSDDPCSG